MLFVAWDSSFQEPKRCIPSTWYWWIIINHPKTKNKKSASAFI